MLQARQGHARLLATRALLRSPEHLSTQGGNEVAEIQVLGHERTATVRLGWDLLQVLLRLDVEDACKDDSGGGKDPAALICR